MANQKTHLHFFFMDEKNERIHTNKEKPTKGAKLQEGAPIKRINGKGIITEEVRNRGTKRNKQSNK